MPIHLFLSFFFADSPKILQSFVLSLMAKNTGLGGAKVQITPCFSESWRSAIRCAGRLFEWTDCGAQCAHAQLVVRVTLPLTWSKNHQWEGFSRYFTPRLVGLLKQGKVRVKDMDLMDPRSKQLCQLRKSPSHTHLLHHTYWATLYSFEQKTCSRWFWTSKKAVKMYPTLLKKSASISYIS